MSNLKVVVDSQSHEVTPGTKAIDFFLDRKDVVVARINGVLSDLARELRDGDVVESVTITSAEGIAVLRHSTAHVLAQAVQQNFPEAKLGIGPPVKDGFYYDFEVERPFTPDDLKLLEKSMDRIIRQAQRFSRRVTDEQSALRELANEPYKCELIGLKSESGDEAVEVGGTELTIYDNVSKDGERFWGDLCRGPHLPSTRYIPAFKLMRTAAAYWRGNEKNPMLQRIYGTAWPSAEELQSQIGRAHV